jgi:DNA-binding NarL/FixJ family response regulator
MATMDKPEGYVVKLETYNPDDPKESEVMMRVRVATITPVMILVVEDYAPIRRVICSWLRGRDFQVMEAGDGSEAIERAIELQPELILFDIGLPTLNGIESARRVRSLVPRAKVVFVTQESSSDMIRETFRLGARGYVHKEQASRDLLPAIDTVLDGQRFVSSSLDFIIGEDVGCA